MTSSSQILPGKDEATISLSLSEIASLAYRASRGAGFEWGEADEAAFAATWLARAGLDWVRPIIGICTAPIKMAPQPAMSHWQAPSTLCPIKTGIALADFATLDEGPSKQSVTIEKVAQPLLLFPFIYVVARKLNSTMAVAVGENEFYIYIDAPPELGATLPPIAASASLRCADKAAPEPKTWPQHHFATISKANYNSLSEIALRTTVPNSAKSLAGAGAGTSDND